MIINEFERKFIIKNLPVRKVDISYLIHQAYFTNSNNEIERIRMSVPTTTNIEIYEHIIKRYIEPGHNTEEIFTIDLNKFKELFKLCHKHLFKTRNVYNYKGQKFEVDYFANMRLIVLEVETKEKDSIINFPPWLKELIICEVTHIKEFSNYNLATKITQ